MIIPSSFTWFGKTWTVALVPKPDPRRSTAWAMTDTKTQQITIDSDLAPETQQQCFIHELLHIVFLEMGLNQPLKIDDDQEEALVDAISNALYSMIRQKVIVLE